MSRDLTHSFLTNFILFVDIAPIQNFITADQMTVPHAGYFYSQVRAIEKSMQDAPIEERLRMPTSSHSGPVVQDSIQGVLPEKTDTNDWLSQMLTGLGKVLPGGGMPGQSGPTNVATAKATNVVTKTIPNNAETSIQSPTKATPTKNPVIAPRPQKWFKGSSERDMLKYPEETTR